MNIIYKETPEKFGDIVVSPISDDSKRFYVDVQNFFKINQDVEKGDTENIVQILGIVREIKEDGTIKIYTLGDLSKMYECNWEMEKFGKYYQLFDI